MKRLLAVCLAIIMMASVAACAAAPAPAASPAPAVEEAADEAVDEETTDTEAEPAKGKIIASESEEELKGLEEAVKSELDNINAAQQAAQGDAVIGMSMTNAELGEAVEAYAQKTGDDLVAEGALAADKTYKIGVYGHQLSGFEYWQNYISGAESGVRASDEFVVVDGQGDVNKLSAALDAALSQKFDAIIISTGDNSTCNAAARALRDAGVVVIYTNICPEDPNAYDGFITTNIYQCGQYSGEALAKALDYKPGKVITYMNPASTEYWTRFYGAADVLMGYGNDVVVIEGKGSTSISVPNIENALQAHPDTIGIWSFAENSAYGAMAVVESQGKDMPITTIDQSATIMEAIQQGKLTACASQRPFLMGSKAMEMAYRALDGDKSDVPERLYLPAVLIDSSNVDKFIDEVN